MAPGIASVKSFPYEAKTAVGSMNHIAFNMDEADLEAALDNLEAAGVPHTHAVVNHDDSQAGVAKDMHEGVFVRSVYFTDPNGIALEASWWADDPTADADTDPAQADQQD